MLQDFNCCITNHDVFSSNPVFNLTSRPRQLYWVPQIAYDAWQGSRSDWTVRTNMTSFWFVGPILQIFLPKRVVVDPAKSIWNLKLLLYISVYNCIMSIYGGDFVAPFLFHNWNLLWIVHFIPKTIRNTLKPTFITSISASRRRSRIHHTGCSNFGDHDGRLMLPLYLWGCLGPQVGNLLHFLEVIWWGWCL